MRDAENLNEPERQETGEPDDAKVSRPVRRGADGKGAAMSPRQRPTLQTCGQSSVAPSLDWQNAPRTASLLGCAKI